MTIQDLPTSAVPVHRRAVVPERLALQLAALALSFILVALLVVTSSRAAFVAQNDNVDQPGQPRRDRPHRQRRRHGDVRQRDGPDARHADIDRCIDVTYTGTVDPTAVLLYANAAPTGTLAPYLNLTIDIGADTADAFRTCTGFRRRPTSTPAPSRPSPPATAPTPPA